MEYLKRLYKIPRDENYEHLVGERRRRVHERVNELLDRRGVSKKEVREEIKRVVADELKRDGVTRELWYYAEGFARGVFEDGSAYTVHTVEVPEQPKANKHNHLGYSAGLVLIRARRWSESPKRSLR